MTIFQETRAVAPVTPTVRSACVPELVAAQARQRPGAPAVVTDSEALTYRELDDRANGLALRLRSLGVGRDVLVGLCLPRSPEMVAAALGILQAGGAYLPMDPAYPADRLAFMLDDAKAPVLVTNSDLARQLPVGQRALVDIDAQELAGPATASPSIDVSPADLAYVIYTSGSTGTPKGVELTHGGLANLVAWHQHAFAVTAADRASHVAGLGFDAAVWELWPYLAAGASVHLADEDTRNSAELLRDWLLVNRITIGFVPAPLAEQMLALEKEWPRTTDLRLLLTGGDVLHHYPPADLPCVLVNNYGPTECTVVATSAPVPPDGSSTMPPPIGRAIDNTVVQLLDERLQPVAPGEPGEIYIGGAGLARGYHDRPELTAERFIPDPFGAEPGGRLYRTGDLGRLLPDGQIAFLGRIDDQVKIRGYRIEPGEISNALERHRGVRTSLVVAHAGQDGDKRLVAYVVLDSAEDAPTHSELREFLRESLPEFMLPAAFVRLDALPLTPHGKVDRAALPAPDLANTLQDAVSTGPRSSTELRVAELVGELLGLEEIGLDDNFFLLGGHSLLGAQLIARLRDTFGVEIELRSLFEAPTVAALAAELERLAEHAGARERSNPAAPGGTQGTLVDTAP
ncbi:MAG TPA: non-ribosomal peptide synthetase [Gemmatimonadales bacterium]|nr:non-ribosomal peptide synthetase [Gemmatimonadales bacterium]